MFFGSYSEELKGTLCFSYFVDKEVLEFDLFFPTP